MVRSFLNTAEILDDQGKVKMVWLPHCDYADETLMKAGLPDPYWHWAEMPEKEGEVLTAWKKWAWRFVLVYAMLRAVAAVVGWFAAA